MPNEDECALKVQLLHKYISGAEFRHSLSRETTIVFSQIVNSPIYFIIESDAFRCSVSFAGGCFFLNVFFTLPIKLHKETNCKIPLVWCVVTIEYLCNQWDQILSPCMLTEQTRLMEVLRGRTGDEQQESRQAEREGGQVAWLFTPRLTDLDNGATASDSDSSHR